MNIFTTVTNWESSCMIDDDLTLVQQDCEGTELETYHAGWANAGDMIEEGSLDINDDERVVQVVFSEFDNMGYER